LIYLLTYLLNPGATATGTSFRLEAQPAHFHPQAALPKNTPPLDLSSRGADSRRELGEQ
jgi:hypothetical protein